MNLALFNREKNGYLNYDFFDPNTDDHFKIFIGYLSEGDIWSNFLIPNFGNSKSRYTCGNYYCTKRDGYDLLLTDFYTLDITDADQVNPVRVNENTVYGMLVAFHTMRVNKVPEFTVTQEGHKYTFYAPGRKSIIVDPDLGNLYNHTVPIVIVRKVNGIFTWETQSINEKDNEQLELLCNLVIKNYPSNLLNILRGWPCIETNKDKKISFNNIEICNAYSSVHLKLKKRPDPKNFSDLFLTKNSFFKFLEAWESRLQFCDSFTLVFLGETLRFFEGEPL